MIKQAHASKNRIFQTDILFYGITAHTAHISTKEKNENQASPAMQRYQLATELNLHIAYPTLPALQPVDQPKH